MISASKFYSRPKAKPRYTTLVKAQDYALSRNCRNIVILPPKSATIDQDSDTENIPEKFVDEDAMFEPAGELEVDCSSSESEDDVTDNQTTNNSKKRKISTPLWKKRTDFSKVIPSIEINKLANDYPELTLKSPFELWRDFMTDTLTQNILEQILLYARRDKNNVNFDLHKAELLRFFGIIILSGYHKLPSERDYWSNQPDLGVPIF